MSSADAGSLDLLVTRALLARGYQVRELRDNEVDVVRPDGLEATLGLANLRRMAAGVEPEALAALVNDRLDAVMSYGTAGQEAPEGPLVPRLFTPPVHPKIWSVPLVAGHLELGLAVDGERAVRFVGPLDLARWGMSQESARSVALGELEERSALVEPRLTDLPGVYEVKEGDALDASRLLICERWLPEAGPVLAIAPCRDLLLFGSAEGPEAALRRQLLGHVARRLNAERAYPLSEEVYRLEEGQLSLAPEGP